MKIRRLLSMAVILLYLLTFAPATFAENDESAATAYNVHITGVWHITTITILTVWLKLKARVIFTQLKRLIRASGLHVQSHLSLQEL